MTESYAVARTTQIARWLTLLADEGTLSVLSSRPVDGVILGHAEVFGRRVALFATDASCLGGTLGDLGARRLAQLIRDAGNHRLPVIGLWHSGGARLQDGALALDAIGALFAAQVAVSGQVPQINVVVGPSAGGAAYGPALGDVIVTAPAGHLFLTGPLVTNMATGESFSAEELGGTSTHQRSGVVHVAKESVEAALQTARDVCGVLGNHKRTGAVASGCTDPSVYLPRSSRRAYGARPIVDAILDIDLQNDPHSVELHPRHAANILTVLGSLGGHPVGVIANNGAHLGGCLDGAGAEKASRFITLCEKFGLPLIVLVDVPGFLPGKGQEVQGVVRRGAQLVRAFASSSVPKLTVIVRKAYGGAYIAMNSKGLGADLVLAWPSAEIGIMASSTAVQVVHRRRLAGLRAGEALAEELRAEYEAEQPGLSELLDRGLLDEVIQPVHTRSRLVEALDAIERRRAARKDTAV